jgi:hypothetical protein
VTHQARPDLGLLLPGTPEHAAFWAEADAKQAASERALLELDRKADADGWAYEYDIYRMCGWLRRPDGARLPAPDNERAAAMCLRPGYRVSVTILRTILEGRT